jgi:excisionase family DNA binding protein
MPEWLTVREAAAYLRVSRSTLYSWCKVDRVRYYNFQGGERAERRFKRDDLDELLKPGKVQEP